MLVLWKRLTLTFSKLTKIPCTQSSLLFFPAVTNSSYRLSLSFTKLAFLRYLKPQIKREDLYHLKRSTVFWCSGFTFVHSKLVKLSVSVSLSLKVLVSSLFLNLVCVLWYFICQCLNLLSSLYPGKKWPQCRHPSGKLLLKIPFLY